MTYESFSQYALYRTLREFLAVHKGQQAAVQLDVSYESGSRVNGEALLKHPMGKIIAALGRAMDEGAVLPGWSNETGEMNWNQFSSFVRWFAKLNRTQQNYAIARMRGGSETPWENPKPQPQPPAPAMESAANPSVPGGNYGLVAQHTSDLTQGGSQAGDLAKPSEGIGAAGWLAIIAAVVSLGFLIYKMIHKPDAQPEEKAS